MKPEYRPPQGGSAYDSNDALAAAIKYHADTLLYMHESCQGCKHYRSTHGEPRSCSYREPLYGGGGGVGLHSKGIHISNPPKTVHTEILPEGFIWPDVREIK